MVSRKNNHDQHAVSDCLDEIANYTDEVLNCVEVLRLIISLSEHPKTFTSQQMKALANQTAAEWDSLSHDLSTLVNRLAVLYNTAPGAQVDTDHS